MNTYWYNKKEKENVHVKAEDMEVERAQCKAGICLGGSREQK